MLTEIKFTLPQNFYEICLTCRGVDEFCLLPYSYRSLRNKFFNESLSARDLHAECKIFKKQFHEEISSMKHEKAFLIWSSQSKHIQRAIIAIQQLYLRCCTVYFKGRKFRGQKLSRFREFFGRSRKFIPAKSQFSGRSRKFKPAKFSEISKILKVKLFSKMEYLKIV